MHRVQLARALALASVMYAATFYVVGAWLKPGYSHSAHFISELNATGTPWAQELGFLGFIPLGLILAAFLLVAYPLARLAGPSRAGFLLLWSQPVAFIGAALAPCDPGCSGGSALQQIHDLLGLATYLAAAVAFFLLSFHSRLSIGGRWYLRVATVAWLVLFVLMLVPELASIRGLLQRVADGLLWITVLLIAWRMLAPAEGASAASDNPSRPTPLRDAA